LWSQDLHLCACDFRHCDSFSASLHHPANKFWNPEDIESPHFKKYNSNARIKNSYPRFAWVTDVNSNICSLLTWHTFGGILSLFQQKNSAGLVMNIIPLWCVSTVYLSQTCSYRTTRWSIMGSEVVVLEHLKSSHCGRRALFCI